MFSVYTLVTHIIYLLQHCGSWNRLQHSHYAGLFVGDTGSRTAARDFIICFHVVLLYGVQNNTYRIVFVISYLRCLIEFRTALPVHNHYVEKWLAERPLKRPILVKQSDRDFRPINYGIFRPVIFGAEKNGLEK